MTDWNKAKVVDLRAELKKRGLPQTGLKPALVARLTASENEDGAESEATVQDETLKIDASAATSPDTISPTQPQSAETILESAPQITSEPNLESIESTAASESDHVESAMTDIPADTVPTQSTELPELSQTPLRQEPERSAGPSIEPEEALEDRQKRKRRSQTPSISSPDVTRKRARKSNEAETREDERPLTESEAAWDEEDGSVEKAATNGPSDANNDNGKEDFQLADKMEIDIKLDDTQTSKASESSPTTARDSRFRDLFNSPQAGVGLGVRLETSEMRDSAYDEAEPERNISPAIHPATATLYIRDFMRPLNASQLRTYLAELATPPGRDVDPEVVVDFYLDPIRTHAFISFTNVSTASRVRSALHGRIWPDERTRKPLWVDFVPSDLVKEWIDLEESHNVGGRGSGKKWEVFYDVDEDRRVIASLEETSNIPMSNHPRKPSTQLLPEALPSQSPTPVVGRGIESAPSAPRAEMIQDQGRPQVGATNTATLDQLFRSTTTKPVLYWLPVSKDIADKRLDALDDATSKEYSNSDPADEINRFTFQNGHVLVDRGPELFGGIRPPRGFRGPQFGPGVSHAPMRRGGFGGGGRGDRVYDSYRGGRSGFSDSRGPRDDRGVDRIGRDFRDDRRY